MKWKQMNTIIWLCNRFFFMMEINFNACVFSDGFSTQVSGPGGVFALPLGGFSLAPIAKPIASRPPPYPPGAVAPPHPHHSLHSLLAHCRHHPYLAGDPDIKHKSSTVRYQKPTTKKKKNQKKTALLSNSRKASLSLKKLRTADWIFDVRF